MPKMQSWLSDAVVPVRAEILRVFEQEWTRLSAPGSFWSGSERVAVAATNRRSRFEGPELDGRLPAAAGDAASLLGAHPAEATREWVEEKTAALGEAAYVELVGVVSRTAAIDSFHVALGAKLPLLPEPVAGDPDGVLDQRAAAGAAWVPMVGGASIVYALSLVPAEFHAQEEMHGPLYLTYEGMQDLKFERGLTRTQMELVAARTSAVNECFY